MVLDTIRPGRVDRPRLLLKFEVATCESLRGLPVLINALGGVTPLAVRQEVLATYAGVYVYGQRAMQVRLVDGVGDVPFPVEIRSGDPVNHYAAFFC